MIHFHSWDTTIVSAANFKKHWDHYKDNAILNLFLQGRASLLIPNKSMSLHNQRKKAFKKIKINTVSKWKRKKEINSYIIRYQPKWPYGLSLAVPSNMHHVNNDKYRSNVMVCGLVKYLLYNKAMVGYKTYFLKVRGGSSVIEGSWMNETLLLIGFVWISCILWANPSCPASS